MVIGLVSCGCLREGGCIMHTCKRKPLMLSWWKHRTAISTLRHGYFKDADLKNIIAKKV